MLLINYFIGYNKPKAKEDISIFLGKVREGAFREMVLQVRNLIEEGKTEEAQEVKKKLPAVTVSALYEGGRRDANMSCYQPIVMLDYDKLVKEAMDEIIAKINADKHTFASFVSPSGCGVKVFVLTQPSEGEVPQSISKVKAYHKQAFAQVADYYGELTGLRVDESGKDPGRLCFVSYDPNLYHNPDSEPVVVKLQTRGANAGESSTTRIINAAYRKIADNMAYEGGHRNTFVYHLANLLNRKGVTREAALEYSSRKFIDLDSKEIKSAVDSAYSHIEDHGAMAAQSAKNLVEEMQKFILDHYEIRHNVVTDRVEIKARGSDEPYERMVDRLENTIWRLLHVNGIKARILDLRLLLKSDFAPNFNPFEDYFNHLPQWDGKDYLAQFADTITVDEDSTYWHFCLRKWMVAMVGSLLHDDIVNHAVLVFIGKQGVGKSKWCERILPPELSSYFTLGDLEEQYVDFLLKLSKFAVNNIDELGALTTHEMQRFNKMISQGVIDERKAYGHNDERYVHRASLVASTNIEQVLVDPSGSRRFPTFMVTAINYRHEIDYAQLYAQVYHLYLSGFQHWFDNDEIEELKRHNSRFVFLTPEEEFLLTYFSPEPIHGNPIYLRSSDILKRISHRTGLQINNVNAMSLGKILNKHQFEHKKTRTGHFYKVYEISDGEIEARLKNPDFVYKPVEQESVVKEKELPF